MRAPVDPFRKARGQARTAPSDAPSEATLAGTACRLRARIKGFSEILREGPEAGAAAFGDASDTPDTGRGKPGLSGAVSAIEPR